MHASIIAATVVGVRGTPVTVELFTKGFPGYRIVGLPDAACRESRDRVRAALLSSRLDYPQLGITVNLAPTSERKSGSGLDLAIALGILVASGQLDAEAVAGTGFFGELGLDGTIRAIPGVAPMVAAVGERPVVVPLGNYAEAEVAAAERVRAVSHLRQLVDALRGDEPWPELELPPRAVADDAVGGREPDLADVRGQPVARRALEIAAAGGHHLLLVGAPGSGKSMLAQRLAGLLPRLGRQQAVETTMIHSAAGLTLGARPLDVPPFRAPHHTSSVVALVGGGSHTLRPGEVSLAHNGVLFLDELGEFARGVLEGLREPLEEGTIRVARAEHRAALPARFLLVAATNPCPCGGGPPGACECDSAARARYLRRLSGPITDRFDLRVAVQRPTVDELLGAADAEPSAAVRRRVVAARDRALDRQGQLNAALPSAELDRVAALEPAAKDLLAGEIERNRLTGRGLHRVRRVARTIADLDASTGESAVSVDHVALALSLRAALNPPFESGRRVAS